MLWQIPEHPLFSGNEMQSEPQEATAKQPQGYGMKRQHASFAALLALTLHCGAASAFDLMDNADLAGSDLYEARIFIPGEQQLHISQIGHYNLAAIEQSGESLLGSIVQQGSHHEAYLLQQGSNLMASIWQQGYGNQAAIVQFGVGNQADIIQSGAHNTASIEQSGSGLYGRITQVGVGQSAHVRQR